MRVAVLATGGKDSTLALYKVLKAGYEVKCLVSMVPLREDSWMFHYPNMHLMDLFAEAVGLPLVKGETTGMKEVEVEDLRRIIAKLDVEGLVCGAIASNYQKMRIEQICRQLNLECIMPLWQQNPYEILVEILDLNFEVVITGVYAYGFSKEWLGRRIDLETVKALADLNRRFGVSLVGEGGEYETLVLDAPFFRKRLKIVEAETVWKGQSGYLLVKRAVLEDKPK
ncbi:TIGR00289 family protein [Candidatus Bathyarchaeota archaeon]|nr:TIGR00289 family protein [Candidatus Bathyarchaeota archaeon]